MAIKNLNIWLVSGLLSWGTAVSVYAAEEPKVEITSFVFAGMNTRASELCGKVTGSSSEWNAVRVTVDPNTNRPGIYNTLAGKDGKFCVAVVSYSGLATAAIGWGSDKEAVSEVAVSVKKPSRL